MQIRYVVGSLLIAGAIGFLVMTSLNSGTMRSVPVSDLRAADYSAKPYVGQRLRVVGFVGGQPVTKSREQSENGVVSVSHFAVVEGKDTVKVSYQEAMPDNFRKGGPVQIDGLYVAPGVMKADHVLTKCPSKYEAGEGAVKEKGGEQTASLPSGSASNS